VTDASGRETDLVIDGANNRITSVSDSAGRTWGFAYDSGFLVLISDPKGNETELDYDEDLLAEITRDRTPAGSEDAVPITWSIAYADDRVDTVTDPIGATYPLRNTFTYDEGSTSVGLLKSYQVDPVDRPATTYALDALGRVTSLTDPADFETTYAYDAASNLPILVRPTGAATQTTTYTYDERANLTRETRQLTDTTSVETAMWYSATNDLLVRSEADNDAATKLVTLYTYDGSGRLTSMVENCTTSGTTPPSDASTCTAAGTANAATNLLTTYSYTANDQLKTETDPLRRDRRYKICGSSCLS
jgi:YD repeat-containing protein